MPLASSILAAANKERLKKEIASSIDEDVNPSLSLDTKKKLGKCILLIAELHGTKLSKSEIITQAIETYYSELVRKKIAREHQRLTN